MDERIAVVTGTASGIGRATAARFARAGYHVSGLDLKQPTGAVEGSYEHYACDVADEANVKRSIEEIVRKHGKIDALINVAGLVLVKPIEESSWDEFQRIVNVNLGGTFLLVKHVVPVMKARKSGAIVNVGSVSGHVGQVNHSLYGATKGAVISFCRALAWELAPYRIRVNSVSPGSVDTPMLRADVEGEAKRMGVSFDHVKREREAEQASGRWADPAEIAEAIFFLAGEGASFINGADVLVDGGWVAK